MLRVLAFAACAAAAPAIAGIAPPDTRGAGNALNAVGDGAGDAVKELQKGLNAECMDASLGACLHGVATGTETSVEWFREHLDPSLRKALNSFGKLLARTLGADEDLVLEYLVDALYPAFTFVASLFRSGASIVDDPGLNSAGDALGDTLDGALGLADEIDEATEDGKQNRQ